MKTTVVNNEIACASDLAVPFRDKGLTGKPLWEAVQEYAKKYHPILLGIVNRVIYEPKTNCYIVHFGESSARATDDTAEFLLREINAKANQPSVYAAMTHGAISSVFLLYL